jgi:hypothetical protein
MKNAILAMMFMMTGWALSATAQEGSVACMYRATLEDGSGADIRIQFWAGDPAQLSSGEIFIQADDGRSQSIEIPHSAIRSLNVQENWDTADLNANTQIQSREVSLMLNYVGDDFANAGAQWLRNPYPTIEDLQAAYRQMTALHWFQPRPVMQMTGSVRFGSSIRKFESTKIVCTAKL